MSYTLYKNITTVNRTVLKNKQNKYIVIHYTGNKTDTAKSNAAYFKSVNRGSSAHYFVDKNSVYQCVEDKDSAWSVGKNYGTKNLFHTVKNSNSINIEMCSEDGTIANETFENTVSLVKTLMSNYNIPASNVYRHYDVCSKKCPGWDGWIGTNESLWKKFQQMISNTSAAVPENTSTKFAVGQTVTYSTCYKTSNDSINKAISCNPWKTGKITKIVPNAKNPYLIENGRCWINDGDIRSSYTKNQFIKDVQTAIGAKADGKAGRETLSKTITVSMFINTRHAVVKPLQNYLNSLGYYCGTPDGVAGSKFRAAVIAYQKANGLFADGIITKSQKTWQRLFGLI